MQTQGVDSTGEQGTQGRCAVKSSEGAYEAKQSRQLPDTGWKERKRRRRESMTLSRERRMSAGEREKKRAKSVCNYMGGRRRNERSHSPCAARGRERTQRDPGSEPWPHVDGAAIETANVWRAQGSPGGCHRGSMGCSQNTMPIPSSPAWCFLLVSSACVLGLARCIGSGIGGPLRRLQH